MAENQSMQVYCQDCREPLNEPTYSGGQRPPCPHCGSLKRRLDINIVEKIVPHDSLRAKGKHPKRTGKKKVGFESFSGDELHKKTRKWFKKERLVDHDNDRYMEKITDPVTGEVVRFCDEPLSQHQGHGSAKKTPPKESKETT
jgi:hypothetical protein